MGLSLYLSHNYTSRLYTIYGIYGIYGIDGIYGTYDIDDVGYIRYIQYLRYLRYKRTFASTEMISESRSSCFFVNSYDVLKYIANTINF